MNTVRCRAMIASALSFVRPARLTRTARLPHPARLTRPPRPACQNPPDIDAIEPPDEAVDGSCPASNSGPTHLNSTEDRAPATSYSLIGW